MTISLSTYLLTRFRSGLSYSDAVQLCLGLYTCANLLPSIVSQQSLNKENISEAFAELARCGGITGEDWPDDKLDMMVTEQQHWVEVIDCLFKTSDDFLNISRVRELLTPTIHP